MEIYDLMIASILIFAVVYIMIASEKIEKSVAAMLGAVAAMLAGLISFDDAMKCIDLNVILLLIAMMTCVSILAETGFFEWVAIFMAKMTKGNATWILALILAITMIFSAFLDNVTTVILLVPVTMLITQLLEIPTAPFIILEAIASNIGGTATLIGDPPNIIIGSRAGISFNEFLIHLGPIAALIGIVFILLSIFILRKHLNVPRHVRARVIDSCPSLAIRDPKNMWISLGVLGALFVGFFLHSVLHIEVSVIALGGMCLMLILCKSKCDELLKSVEWDTILFFIGLFIITGALEHNGVIKYLAEGLLQFCGDNMLLTCILVMWGSAFCSAILDNIPFVIAMTPLAQHLLEKGDYSGGPHPLLWSLALGACLGGNGTLIGASANVVACKLAERNHCKISFLTFMKWGMPLMVLQIIICTVYVYFRYF